MDPSYHDFREHILRSAVREDDLFANDPLLEPELVWQGRWFSGDFGTRFQTPEGAAVEIISFGHWNHAAGPDFLDATISLDGEVAHGAIELDPTIEDWERHGHAANPAYRSVVLHLLLKAPEKTAFTRDCEHRMVPQVVLQAPQAPARAGDVPPEAWPGRCSCPLQDMPAEKARALLLSAARYRASNKAARFRRRETAHGRSEAWLQGIAEVLGYRHNSNALRMLVQRLPLRRLRADPESAEAQLFGIAGFLDQWAIDNEKASDTRHYLRKLWEIWWRHRTPVAPDRQIPWQWSGIRPVNHPQRRIATLAILCDQWPRWQAHLQADTFNPRKTIRFLTGLQHPFWSHHYTFSSARQKQPVALVGRERAIDFLGNIALPVLIDENDKLLQVYEELPGPQMNSNLRRVALRLLGRRPDAGKFTRHFALQQGLLQIYDDFCLADHSGCKQCPFPEQLQWWPGLNS